MERQPRLGPTVGGETPETSALKGPCERTPIVNERAQVSSCPLHSYTHTHRPIPDVARRSREPFTHICRAERECKSAKMALSPAQTTVLELPMLVRAFLRTELALPGADGGGVARKEWSSCAARAASFGRPSFDGLAVRDVDVTADDDLVHRGNDAPRLQCCAGFEPGWAPRRVASRSLPASRRRVKKTRGASIVPQRRHAK